MTNSEIHDITGKYILITCGEPDPNMQHEFENFMSWLQKDYELIRKGSLRQVYKDFYTDLKRLDGSEVIPATHAIVVILEYMFGKKLFEDLKK